MVGSGGGSDRSKEAVGMMALHEALRTVCLNSDWTYSVFWTIRPRPYVFYLFMYVSSSNNFIFLTFLHAFSSSSFIAGGSEVEMVAKLEMTMVACKYQNITLKI